MSAKLQGTSKNDEIQTPDELYQRLNRACRFNYDAFASHENTKVPGLYSTKEGTFSCLQCAAPSAWWNSPPVISGRTQRNATGSIATAATASALMPERDSSGGAPIPSSGHLSSPRSAATAPLSADVSGNGEPPMPTTTSADTPSMTGAPPIGSAVSQHGLDALIAAAQGPSKWTMSSQSQHPTAPVLWHGTSCRHASTAHAPKAASNSPAGLTQAGLVACCSISKISNLDGFTNSWTDKIVWINPPYSLLMQAVAKFEEEVERAAWIAMLVKVDTSTRWYQRLEECAIVQPLKRRVKYTHPDPPPGWSGATFASAIAFPKRDWV